MSIMTEAAIQAIYAERQRQQEEEGWTVEHDDTHSNGDIAKAAAAYAWLASCEDYELSSSAYSMRNHDLGIRKKPLTIWPWDMMWWKPKDRRSDLIRAAALIVAEIERLDRQKYRITF